MMAKKDLGVEISPRRLNTIQEMPQVEPGSMLAEATSLLSAGSHDPITPQDITLIPVDLSTSASVVISLQRPINIQREKAKGLDSHELRIQRLDHTETPKGEMDVKSRQGFDTGHDAMVLSVNGTSRDYFSPEVTASEQTISITNRGGKEVTVPLYVPVLFFSDKGKSVAILTRFPRQGIKVEASNVLDNPVGTIDPGAGRIPRTDRTEGTYQWALEGLRQESPNTDTNGDLDISLLLDQPPGTTFASTAVDSARTTYSTREADLQIPEENFYKREISQEEYYRMNPKVLELLSKTDANLLKSAIFRTDSTPQSREKALSEWRRKTGYRNEPSLDALHLVGKIFEITIARMDDLDTRPKTNDFQIYYDSRPAILGGSRWRIHRDWPPKHLQKLYDNYHKKGGSTLENYIQFAAFNQLAKHGWLEAKSWKVE